MSALAVASIKSRGIHFVGGVTGLALNVTKYGSRSWVMRFQIKGKRRDMGLGSYPSVTLAQARESARAAREVLRQGMDPVEHARAARQRLIVEQETAVVFADAATHYIATHEHGWRNAKHAQQWRNTLNTYASPHFGRLSVSEIDQSHVLRALSPIWKSKTETATRVRGRIEQVLDWATAHGHRTGPNPARWRGQLEHILANPEKVAPVKHRAAVPVADLPAAYQQIAAVDGQSARALCFLILTAVRSGEVRGMVWSEVDLDAALWVIPAERMKANREHRVPLSLQAVELLRTQEAAREELVEHVFPSNRKGSLSDMAFTALMRRHELGAVPHGFRSTFRDWAGETTHHPRDAVELCLAHTIDTKTEAAYRRGDMLEKRAAIMQEWADYAAPIANKKSAE